MYNQTTMVMGTLLVYQRGTDKERQMDRQTEGQWDFFLEKKVITKENINER